MTTQATLPRPAEWTRRDRGLWYTPCLTLALALGIVTIFLALNNIVSGAVTGALTVLFGYLAVAFPRPRPVRVELAGGAQLSPLITLTYEGIVLTRRTIPWERITDISAWRLPIVGFTLWQINQNVITVETDDPADAERGWWGRLARMLVRHAGATLRVVRLGTDPVVAYHAMRFYWQHPEVRAELASEAGVRRIRSQRLA